MLPRSMRQDWDVTPAPVRNIVRTKVNKPQHCICAEKLTCLVFDRIGPESYSARFDVFSVMWEERRSLGCVYAVKVVSCNFCTKLGLH